MIAPTLATDRLILRMPVLADFDHRAAHAASPRADLDYGRMDRAEAWRYFASEVGLWPLRGYGPFSVADGATGVYLGEVGIYHPPAYPEPELGWMVVPAAEGNGIAYEAARAVMVWARRSFGWDRLVNYVNPRNARSIALGLRLGGVRDSEAVGEDPGDVVIVHDLRGLA
jgi:RimJ/RimL family protein N-acetyltransferase